MSDTTTTNGDARKRGVKYDYDPESHVITQTIVAGESELAPDGLTREFHLSRLSPEMRAMLECHGLCQKLADSHAGYRKDASKDPVSSPDAVWEGLLNGVWAAGRDGAQRLGLFIEAYAQFRKVEVDVARRAINAIAAGNDEAKKAAMESAKTNPKIVAIMKQIELARAQERARAARDAAKNAADEAVAALF